MAEARFIFEGRNQDITRRFGAPKKMTMEGWFKATRKMIPEVPNPKETDFQIVHEEANIRAIRFDLRNSIGESCRILIDRRKSFIGGG